MTYSSSSPIAVEKLCSYERITGKTARELLCGWYPKVHLYREMRMMVRSRTIVFNPFWRVIIKTKGVMANR